MELKRVREDIFRCKFFNDISLCPYDIDFVDKDEMVEKLAKAGRAYVKRGLCLLSREFKGLFDNAPKFRSTKEENVYFLELLKEKVNQLYDMDFSEVVEQKNNQIYAECEELERELKQKIYSTYMKDYGEKLRAKLQAKADFDSVGWVENHRQNIISILQSIIEQSEVYYVVKNETARKQEQRCRDLIFCQIMQGLSFFYDNDCPVYDGTDTPMFSDLRAKYSIIDILSIRACLGLDYDRYSIDSIVSYFHCLEAFHRDIEEFSDSGFYSYFDRVLNM